jgi:hypothetical protein
MGARMVESAPSVNSILCGTESWFTQRTVDPTFTVMLAGSNAKFFMGIVLADTDVVVCGAGMVVTVGNCVVCRGAGTVVGGRTDGAVWVHPHAQTSMRVTTRRMKPLFID